MHLIPDVKPVNTNKARVLSQYPLIIPASTVQTLKMNPVLMGRKFLLQKMEALYNQLFIEVQKSKSIRSLRPAEILKHMLGTQFKNSPNYVTQSLANLVYSAHRFAEDHPEISLFLDFLQTVASPDLLFYLFMRQMFIIVTRTSFLSHFKSPRDFGKLTVSKGKSLEVLKRAFQDDSDLCRKFVTDFHLQFRPQRPVPYYAFLVFCVGQGSNPREMDLMTWVEECYKRKQRVFPRSRDFYLIYLKY